MAELLEGPAWYSYNLTVETKINIDELIYTLHPDDLPLLSGVGADGLPVLQKQPVDNTIFYWLEEEVALPRATLDGALDGSQTDVTVLTGEAVKFRVGDGIRIEDEIMLVTDIDTTTDVLTVTRGSATVSGTTAATHVDAAEVIGLGTILVEGDIGAANYTGRDRYSNYCQIYSGKIRVSRTAQRIPKYGVPNELNKQTANQMHVTHLGMENSALYGVKFQHATNNRRQTGGLDYFVTTNEDTASDHLTIDSIEQMQQDVYDNGGSFKYLMSRPNNFVALNNTAGSERIQTVTIDDARRGRRRATVVMTEFGEVMLVRNRWVKRNEAFAFSPDNFVQRVFHPLTLEKLAKSDDTDTFMMVAENGYEVKGEAHCAKWTGLDSTAVLPGDGLT